MKEETYLRVDMLGGNMSVWNCLPWAVAAMNQKKPTDLIAPPREYLGKTLIENAYSAMYLLNPRTGEDFDMTPVEALEVWRNRYVGAKQIAQAKNQKRAEQFALEVLRRLSSKSSKGVSNISGDVLKRKAMVIKGSDKRVKCTSVNSNASIQGLFGDHNNFKFPQRIVDDKLEDLDTGSSPVNYTEIESKGIVATGNEEMRQNNAISESDSKMSFECNSYLSAENFCLKYENNSCSFDSITFVLIGGNIIDVPCKQGSAAGECVRIRDALIGLDSIQRDCDGMESAESVLFAALRWNSVPFEIERVVELIGSVPLSACYESLLGKNLDFIAKPKLTSISLGLVGGVTNLEEKVKSFVAPIKVRADGENGVYCPLIVTNWNKTKRTAAYHISRECIHADKCHGCCEIRQKSLEIIANDGELRTTNSSKEILYAAVCCGKLSYELRIAAMPPVFVVQLHEDIAFVADNVQRLRNGEVTIEVDIPKTITWDANWPGSYELRGIVEWK